MCGCVHKTASPRHTITLQLIHLEAFGPDWVDGTAVSCWVLAFEYVTVSMEVMRETVSPCHGHAVVGVSILRQARLAGPEHGCLIKYCYTEARCLYTRTITWHPARSGWRHRRHAYNAMSYTLLCTPATSASCKRYKRSRGCGRHHKHTSCRLHSLL